MRIVGGRLKGRRITVPKDGVRPTSERVREALMSMLGPDWAGRHILDCYAGSGAFGFEALSWGAAHVTFIERNAKTVANLRATAELLQVSSDIRIVQNDASRALQHLRRRLQRFDLLFFDPPYADSQPEEILSHAVGLAKSGAALVWECGARAAVPERVQGWERCISRRYGSTDIAVYRLSTGGA